MELLLEPLPPFRLDLTVWALRRRPANTVDRWDGETYRRVIELGGEAVEIAVVQTGPADAPELRVDVAGRHDRKQEVAAVCWKGCWACAPIWTASTPWPPATRACRRWPSVSGASNHRALRRYSMPWSTASRASRFP